MAVVLDDEETLTVGPDGKATLLKRRVIRILRPQGRNFANVVVPIDRDRKLRSLHIWSIAADGHPYTLRDNEIVEVVPYDANRGGLLVELEGIRGFLPVSQLAAGHYPRVSGADKDEILQKLHAQVSC